MVSTAGPAMPVLKHQNDSVPNGWMARLEAAKVAAQEASGPVARPRGQPPPLKRNATPPPLKKSNGNGNGGSAHQPAHLLVAQIEAEERRRQHEEQARLQQLFEGDPQDEIAQVEVDLPEETPKRRPIPNWVVATLLVVLVTAGVAVVYSMATKKPAPVAEVDPELLAERQRRTEAMAALEKGHMEALKGETGADAAIAAYKKALELEPTLAAAVRGIAIAHASKKEDARAVRHYRRYLKMKPDAKDAADVRDIIKKYEKSHRKKGKK